MTKITLYFDTISPYSLFAFTFLSRYESVWKNTQFVYKPVFLGGIMSQAKNQPPGVHPGKAKQMMRDLSMQKELYQLPLLMMPNLLEQAGKLEMQRLLAAITATRPDDHEVVRKAIEGGFKLRWQDKSTRKPNGSLELTDDDLRGLCTSLGLDPDATLAAIRTEGKQQLQTNTEEALKHGAYGAPWIVVEHNGKTTPFFGSDRMELIAHTINQPYLGPVPTLANL